MRDTSKARRMAYMAPLFFAGAIVFIAAGGFVVRGLWNWLLPPLFGLPVVTFWQAVGLLALSRILFGGLGRGGGYHRRRDRFTPEERERLKAMAAPPRNEP